MGKNMLLVFVSREFMIKERYGLLFRIDVLWSRMILCCTLAFGYMTQTRAAATFIYLRSVSVVFVMLCKKG